MSTTTWNFPDFSTSIQENVNVCPLALPTSGALVATYSSPAMSNLISSITFPVKACPPDV
jgi:hypothetical protein